MLAIVDQHAMALLALDRFLDRLRLRAAEADLALEGGLLVVARGRDEAREEPLLAGHDQLACLSQAVEVVDDLVQFLCIQPQHQHAGQLALVHDRGGDVGRGMVLARLMLEVGDLGLHQGPCAVEDMGNR